MKTKAERLDDLLESYAYTYQCSNEEDCRKVKEEILALLMECVPEETPNKLTYIQMGFNLCRAETLKNMEEMGK